MTTVVIDPGHGGSVAISGSSPNNATGPNGLLEKDVTLDLGRRVSALLASRASVILTRTTDVNLSLSDRAKVARDANADVFLSIHLNGWKDPSVDGTETWVAKNASAASRDLAQRVLTHVVGVTHARNRGVKEEDFGVIRTDRQAPGTAASLVEVAFLTNPGEAERFTHDDYKQAVAQAIADAIVERLPAPAPPTAQSLSGGGPATTGTIFLAPNITNTYTDYIQPVTRGDLQPLINGNSSNPASPKTEPLDEMQSLIQTLGEGDSVYLSAWYFDPTTPLTLGAYKGNAFWGNFLAIKAIEGVKIRILATDFDPIEKSSHANVRFWMSIMDSLLTKMPATSRDNLQYVVSMQPVTMGPLHGTIFVGRWSVNIGSHHQKFMVVKKGEETLAFCGGLDIESRKTPSQWGYTPDKAMIGWHDIHVKMRGPIARDLEKEFTLRWNRESGKSTVVPSPNPWSGFATLPVPSPAAPGEVDASDERKQEDVQMERTVSTDDTIGFTTNQGNIKQIYKNIVNASQSFLYFENQYFRSSDLADWIVAKGNAAPSMPVIFVVLFSAGWDDGDDEITQQGDCLQFQFFDKVVKALGSRAAIYTMTGRSVHSKFQLADDRYMTIGSANANERGFQLDSELNVAIDDSKLSAAFRKRLWAHNLGVTEAIVSGWSVSDFITQWDAVATANSSLAPSAMAGEGVVRWDYTKSPGNCHVYIPDYLADNDADRGDEPNKGGLVAMSDVPTGADDVSSATGGDDGGTAIA